MKGDCYIKDRKCIRCEKLIRPFNPAKSKEKKYCSNYCKWNKDDVITNKKCKVCKKLLKPFHSHTNKLYCSRKCQHDREAYKRIKRKCRICNKIIIKARDAYVDNWCCSFKCKLKLRRECKVCGNIIKFPKKYSNAFCKECYMAYSSLKNFLPTKKGSSKFLNKNKELILAYTIYKRSKNELANSTKRNTF